MKLGECEVRRRASLCLPACLAGAIAGLIYYLTSAPTISWAHNSQDSGELAGCAATLGIAHPTGYPLYTLLGWLAIHVFPWIDPARVMVLLSVLSSAVGVGIIARTGTLAVRLAWDKGQASWANGRRAELWGGLAAGFAAINYIIWSQAVICEVYSLAFLFQALGWFCLVKYLELKHSGDESGAGKVLIAFGFVVGLIFSHHIAGASILLPALIVLLFRPPKRPVAAMAKSVAAMLPGLASYIYLPVRSLQNPFLDWGNPENLRNFLGHVTASQYQHLVFGVSWEEFWARAGVFQWPMYWGIIGVVLAFAGILACVLTRRITAIGALVWGIVPYSLWILAFATGYDVSDFYIFYYPLAAPVSILIALGLAFLATRLVRFPKALPWALAAFVLGVLIVNGGLRWVDMDCSNPLQNSAAISAQKQLSEMPQGSLIALGTDGGLFSLMYGSLCGITDAVTGEKLPPRDDLDMLASGWVLRKWYRENTLDRYGPDGRLKMQDDQIKDFKTALSAFVDLNLVNRPVYVDIQVRTQLEQGPGVYQFEPRGTLFEVSRDKD